MKGSLSGRPTEGRALPWQPVFLLSMGYDFGYMIASAMLFDSGGGFSRSSYSMTTQPISRF